jgi:alginate biosynthesis protein AlgX
MKRPTLLLGAALAALLTTSNLHAAPSQITLCDAAINLPNPLMTGLNGWLFLKPEFLSNRFAYEGQYEPLKRFNQALWTRGIKLLTIPIPNRTSVYSDGIDTSQAVQAKFNADFARSEYNDSVYSFRNAGISTVNVMEAMREYGWTGGKERLFFSRDHHWTPSGARVTAQATGKEVKAWSSFYGSLPKVDYVSQASKPYPFSGSVPGMLEDTCPGIKVPSETAQGYVTTRKTAGSLFEDEQIDVALVGTSFSGPPWGQGKLDFNFTGFLQEELKTNVSNYAIGGGGYDSSLETYLLSEEYTKHKPKFLLYEFWFFPYGQTLHSFRRIIPSIYGACNPTNAVANGPTVPLLTGKLRPVIYTPGTAGVKGSSKYVYMKLSDDKILKFNTILTYDDGQTETVPVERSGRFKNNDGRYFLELNDKYTSNLLSVAIQTQTTTQSKVTARICNVPAAINTN